MKKTGLIKDIRIYNPTNRSNKGLADDWRIICAYYSRIKEKKKFVYTEEEVLNIARLIYLEMQKRIKAGKIKYTFQPEKMKPSSKELYLIVQKPIIGARRVADSKETEFLPIYPGGTKPRYNLLSVEDFTSRWKSFVLKEPCVYLVGSLPNWNMSDGDIDIVIRDTEDSQNFERIKWRIQRAFPDLKDRLQFHDDSWHGQFTNYVNLGKLMIQAPEDYRVMKMEDMEKDEFQLRTKEVSVIKEAEISKKEDRLKMFRFFFPLKGIHGYRVGEKYRVEQVVTFFKPEDYPLITQKKYDGNRQIVFKQGAKVEIWSEDGTEVTHRMPKTVAELKRIAHPRDFILDSETEMWVGKEHQSREVTAGYLHGKDKPDDSGLVVNVFDMLYCYDPGIKKHDLNLQAGDIHNEEYALRLKYLDTLPFKQSTIGIPNPGLSHLNRTPDYVSDRPAKLIQDIRTNSKAIASEGAMIKSSHSTYPLTGMTSKWVKFKTMVEIHAKIWKRNPTKTKGVYNYDVSLRVPTGIKVDPKYIIKFRDNPNTYLKVGRSYNTKTFAKPGQICTLSIHTLNVYRNPETGEIRLHVYEPRWYELRPEQTEPDSIVEAIRTAREAKVLQVKKIGSEQLEDPFLEYPPEGWVGRYVVQHHYRAGIDPKLKPKEKPLASAHVDARFELPDYLVGMTWADQMKGMVPDVRTMQEARRIDRKTDAFKIDWLKGTFKKIKTAAGRIVPREILAIPKAREPREWLLFEGVVKPGTVGATRFGPGVFTIIDKGKVEWGTQKPYYHEYFLYGDKLKGRIVYRLLPAGKYRRIGEQKYFWVVIQPLEQEPYVLSRRAVTKKWIPPLGHSALPDSVKKQIPKDYHYWDTSVKTKADMMKIRDELVEMIKKREIKIDYNKIRTEEPPATTKKLEAELALSRDYFILQHTWVRGQKVIRVGPSAEHWDLALRGTRPEKDRWILLSNPVETDKNASVHEPWTSKEWNNHAVVIPKSIKEPLLCPPGHPLNFKKTADVFVQTLDHGYCTILDKKQDYMKIRFDGKLKNLRGIWVLIQETPSEKTWTFERAESIGEPIRKRESFMGENGWLKITGLAMRPGWFKSKFFSKDVLRAAVLVPRDNERLSPIDIFHSPDKQDRIGVLSRIFWDENVRWKGKDDGKHHVGALMYEGFLFDKPSIDSCVDGKLRKNSVEMLFTGEPIVETLKIDGLGLVFNPAIPEAAATHVCDDKKCKTF